MIVVGIEPALALCADVPDNDCEWAALACVGGRSAFGPTLTGACEMLEEL